MKQNRRTSAAPRVLALSIVFPPDGVSTAQLFGELVEDMSASGYEMVVVTTSPHYNYDEHAATAQPIRWKRFRILGKSDFKGVAVTHLRMPKKAASTAARALQWIWFGMGSLFLVLAERRRGLDAIVTVSPPPTVAAVSALVRRLYGVPFLYILWELYPDIAAKLGALSTDSMLYKGMKRIERWTYRSADALVVLHDAMRDSVVATGADPARTFVVPTFADTDFLRPLPRATTLRAEHGLTDAFVVGYAGNLGGSQDLESLLAAAEQLVHRPEIQFLVCGDGIARSSLESSARSRGLSNVTFTGHLPYTRVPEIYASFDLAVVVLAAEVAAEALPSKIYRIMACGRPILALTALNSPLASLVETHGAGFVHPLGEATTLAELIAKLEVDADLLTQKSGRGRAAAEQDFSRSAVRHAYEGLLQRMIENTEPA